MARLLLLGPAREAAGRREDVVDAPTVGAVLRVAVQRYGGEFELILAHSQIWLNGDAADLAASVGDQDEVAVLPPVSGG